MENKEIKPKQSSHQLIAKMKDKGITFNYCSEAEAEAYLLNINNYFRTASYRKNYTKHSKGIYAGQYINLDFSYLKELSTIDMHLRFLVSKMCLDIEHDLKVQLLKDIEINSKSDGYQIVFDFLNQNPYILTKIAFNSTAPFVSDLINKYFTLSSTQDANGRIQNCITHYDNCPAWVLLELLTFGDFIRLFEFYYNKNKPFQISTSLINLTKSLRNACAHNNCILANLSQGTSKTPSELSKIISKISSVSSTQRQKKLSCRPMLEFVSLLYVYNQVVSSEVKKHRTQELKDLFFSRMLKKQNFFRNNDLIKSNYEFICKIISYFFD